MMCYRDMTFCSFYEDCSKASDCNRPLTPEVKAAANRWFNGESDTPIAAIPISVFAAKPGCHEAAIDE